MTVGGKRIAIHARVGDRDELHRLEARERRGGHACAPPGRALTCHRGPCGEHLQGFALAGAESRDVGILRVDAARRHQAGQQVAAAIGEPRDAHRLERVHASGEPVRRHRRRERGARTGEVVVSHPARERHDIGRHERRRVEDLDHFANLDRWVERLTLAKDDAGQLTRAERNDDTRARRRPDQPVGHRIGEQAECRVPAPPPR